jgi:hypothetical protein
MIALLHMYNILVSFSHTWSRKDRDELKCSRRLPKCRINVLGEASAEKSIVAEGKIADSGNLFAMEMVC